MALLANTLTNIIFIISSIQSSRAIEIKLLNLTLLPSGGAQKANSFDSLTTTRNSDNKTSPKVFDITHINNVSYIKEDFNNKEVKGKYDKQLQSKELLTPDFSSTGNLGIKENNKNVSSEIIWVLNQDNITELNEKVKDYGNYTSDYNGQDKPTKNYNFKDNNITVNYTTRDKYDKDITVDKFDISPSKTYPPNSNNNDHVTKQETLKYTTNMTNNKEITLKEIEKSLSKTYTSNTENNSAIKSEQVTLNYTSKEKKYKETPLDEIEKLLSKTDTLDDYVDFLNIRNVLNKLQNPKQELGPNTTHQNRVLNMADRDHDDSLRNVLKKKRYSKTYKSKSRNRGTIKKSNESFRSNGFPLLTFSSVINGINFTLQI
ncbi:unnamed protein product [Diatraea saccharalis]|uniref:Uncharacterized protein n=1 Tax=Diatraea saccharalis TaxID=40085 RepID=A0A9N9WK39_9NEOP|nr:unnamed protein product [Diatraea saccharalis]